MLVYIFSSNRSTGLHLEQAEQYTSFCVYYLQTALQLKQVVELPFLITLETSLL